MRPNKTTKFIAAIAAFLATPFVALAAYSGDTGLTASGSAAGLDTAPGQLPIVIGTVIKTGLGLVGVVFLVLMVYAGYIWMIARGDESKVDKAKDTITNAIIGIVIVVGAYALTNYVVGAFTKQTGAAGGDSVSTCTASGNECASNTTKTSCSNGTCVAP